MRHGAVPVSVPESELYMGRLMIKLLDIPGKVWADPLRDGIGLFFLGINQAMIQTVRTGRNPTMRYLGQVHRIAVVRSQ